MSAHQMQKLVKKDEPVFIEVVRTSNKFAPHKRRIRGRKKESPGYTVVNFAHGMIEGQKRKTNKESRLKKDIVTVKE